MRQVLQSTALAAVAGLAASGVALAHAHLELATPPENGTVAAAPAQLDLVFSEGVNPKFSGATIAGPDQVAVATGTPMLGKGGDTTLVVPLEGKLGAGAYTVSWHALSTDGHKTHGKYTFTVKP